MSCSVRNPTSTDPYSSMISRDVFAGGEAEPVDVEARAGAGGDALLQGATDRADAVGSVGHLVRGLPAVALAVEYTADVSVMFVRYHTLTNPSVSP
mgnify:CR=1 FL=1